MSVPRGPERANELAPTPQEIDQALDRLEDRGWDTLTHAIEESDQYMLIYQTEALWQALVENVNEEMDPHEVDYYRSRVSILEEKIDQLGFINNVEMDEEGYFPEHTTVQDGEGENLIELDLYSMQHQVDAMREILEHVEEEHVHDEAAERMQQAGVSTETAQEFASVDTAAEQQRAIRQVAEEATEDESLGQKIVEVIRSMIEAFSSGMAAFAEAISSIFRRGTERERTTPDLVEAPESTPETTNVTNNTNINLDAVLNIANDFNFARFSIETPEGNNRRPALVVVPRNYDPTVISVVCHGTGGNRGIGEGANAENRLNSILAAAAGGNAITIIPFAYDGAEDGASPGELAGRGGSAAERRGYDNLWFSPEVGEDFAVFIESMLESDSIRNLDMDVSRLIISGFSAGGAALRNIASSVHAQLVEKYFVAYRFLDASYGSWADPVQEAVARYSDRSAMQLFVKAGTETEDNSDHLEGSTGVSYTRYNGSHGDSIDYSRVV